MPKLSTIDLKSLQSAMVSLRVDALARGMDDLAMVYGWSAIRVGQEYLDMIVRPLQPKRAT